MVSILLRRFINLIIIMFVVGTLLFFLVRVLPGDPAVAILGPTAKHWQIEELRKDLGLSGPLYMQYFGWFFRMFQGDFGQSVTYHAPVLPTVMGHLLPTVELAVISTALSFFIAVGISTWIAAFPRNIVARFVNQVTQIGLAIPNFWLALVFIFLFAVQLRIVPSGGYTNFWEDPVQAAWQMVLPITVLTLSSAAGFVIVLNEGMTGEMSHMYLRTARVKGLGEFAVAYKHALPNALMPILTIVGLNFATMIAGVVLIEQIFVIPGLGQMMLQAVYQRDYLLLQAGALFAAFLFVAANLLTDLTYALVNPKVRVS